MLPRIAGANGAANERTAGHDRRPANPQEDDHMTDGELLAYMGDDAAKWASEFCKIARDLGHDIDEGWMIGWFANAIEHSSHIRKIEAVHLNNSEHRLGRLR
jgi:hypothetical protein